MTPRSGSDGITVGTAYVLAGGRSRRFGSDKARFIHDGKTLLQHAIDLVEPLVDDVFVVACDDGQYDDLGVVTIGDVVADRGPIGGLQTIVTSPACPRWFFLVACDWVGANSKWLTQLTAAARESAQAIAFRDDKAGRHEPTFALYQSSIAPLVARRLDQGLLDLQGLLDTADTVAVPLPGDWHAATNLNRRVDAGDELG